MNFTGGRLFFARCPFAGLVSRDSFTNSTRPIWAASYPSFVADLVLRDHARTSLQHRDRANVALRVKQLRHADLLAQNSRDLRCHFLLHAQLGVAIARAPIGWKAFTAALLLAEADS